MKRLIFVTQRADPQDPLLGATVPKLRALAARLDELVVLADSSVPGSLPSNCRVHHFAAPTRMLRGARFASALTAELRPRPLALVAHMCPIYAVLAAPLLRPLRVPIVLWYVHHEVKATLRLATRFATHVVSVARESFPLETSKLSAIGHGIDVAAFPCVPVRNSSPFRIVALGRYAPVKRLDVVADSVALARSRGVDVELVARGPAFSENDRAYRASLEGRGGLDVGDSVGPSEVAELLSGADALVSNTRGGADKVVLEAASSCRPVLASSPAFASLLGGLEPPLRFSGTDPAELADRIEELAALQADDRFRLGRELRRRAEAFHSVDAWADSILELVAR